MPSHGAKHKIWPPMTGARIGAIPLTSMSIAKSRVKALPLQISRAMARDRTIPAPPAQPWMKRNKRKMAIDEDRIQPTVDKVKIAIPTIKGRQRPLSSLIGPTAICPRAIPVIEVVNVSWMTDGVTPKAVIIDGRAGKYISVDSGAMAASIPKNTVMSKSQRLRLVCVIL